MAKNSVFKSARAAINKKLPLQINAELFERLGAVEVKAEKLGISFPVNQHLEKALEKLVTQAEVELDQLDKAAVDKQETTPLQA